MKRRRWLDPRWQAAALRRAAAWTVGLLLVMEYVVVIPATIMLLAP